MYTYHAGTGCYAHLYVIAAHFPHKAEWTPSQSRNQSFAWYKFLDPIGNQRQWPLRNGSWLTTTPWELSVNRGGKNVKKLSSFTTNHDFFSPNRYPISLNLFFLGNDCHRTLVYFKWLPERGSSDKLWLKFCHLFDEKIPRNEDCISFKGEIFIHGGLG
jgi:hypothetical protein